MGQRLLANGLTMAAHKPRIWCPGWMDGYMAFPFYAPEKILSLSLVLSSQFRCGEWTVSGAQPPGPPGQPWLWSGYTGQLSSQPATGILPLPLRL